MSDPNVESCESRQLSDSGKWRCVFKGRQYYHCSANREELCCPKGLTTTYDDPIPKLTRKSYSMDDQINSFHKNHIANRWNLKNRLDAFQLHYQLDLLGFRYLELWMALSRAGHYKEAHQAWGKHKAYEIIDSELFPYDDGSSRYSLSNDFRYVQRRLMELEQRTEWQRMMRTITLPINKEEA
jgi:hypothetical protein